MSTKRSSSNFRYKSNATNFEFDSNFVVGCAFSMSMNDTRLVIDFERLEKYDLANILKDIDDVWKSHYETHPTDEEIDSFFENKDVVIDYLKQKIGMNFILPFGHLVSLQPLNRAEFNSALSTLYS